jgi:diguanylate cyclase (GGDEF)-like protein
MNLPRMRLPNLDADRAWSIATGVALPMIALLVGAKLGEQLAKLTREAFVVAAVLPLLLAFIGVALAARFDRGRSFHALLLTAAVYLVLYALHGAHDGLGVRLTWALLCVAVPVLFTALALLADRGVVAPWRDARFLLLLAPVALGALAALAGADRLVALLALPIGPLTGTSPIPPLAQLLFGIAAAVLYGRFYGQPTLPRGALLGALVAVAIALHRVAEPSLVVGLLGATFLLLTLGVLQESWSVAYVDPLTGLPGRRALEERLRSLGPRYAIAMVDVDHFKGFNDRHGHHVGDEVLRLVAAHLREVGGGGLPFRYGGEEFTVVFAEVGAEAALPHLEALREEIADARFAKRRQDRRGEPTGDAGGAEDAEFTVTVSIGLAEGRSGAPPHGVIDAADEALYAAKRRGRNRTETAPSG